MWPYGHVIDDGGALEFPAHGTTQTETQHQPGNGATRPTNTVAVQLRPNLADPVNPEVFGMHPCNLKDIVRCHEPSVSTAVAFWRHILVRGENCNTVQIGSTPNRHRKMSINIGHFLIRPSSSVEKKTDAALRISLARHSSQFSRSKSLTLDNRSPDVIPDL